MVGKGKKQSVVFLIAVIFFSYFAGYVPKVNAQASGGGSGDINVGGIVGSVAACVVDMALLGKLGKNSDTEELTKKKKQEAEEKAKQQAAQSTTVPTADKGATEEIEGTTNEAENTKTKVIVNNLKEYCFDSIEKTIVSQVIDKMTLATVDWINNGFKGDPFYISEPGLFFQNLAVGEINGFLGFYANPGSGIGEFAEGVAEAIYQNLQRSTYSRFQNSLALVLNNGTPQEFSADFNVGGWVGYTAMFEPQNNPFGSYLMASDEIGKRIKGVSYNRIENYNKQLDLSGGYLDQEVCYESGTHGNDYIDKTNELYLGEFYQPLGEGQGLNDTDIVFATLPVAVQNELSGISDPFARAEAYNTLVLRSRCLKWRTTTPGSIISDQISETLGSPLRQLELTDEFQESLGLIFDALLNQLINGDQNGGLLGLDPQANSDPLTNPILGQVNGLQPGQQSISTPITEVINGDGGQNLGVVQYQLDYINQADDNIAKINETILAIKALDYCVPGPNPMWYTDALQYLDDNAFSIPSSTSGDPAVDQQYYADAIEIITGINLSPTPEIQDYADYAGFIVYVFNAYRDAMYDTGNGGYSINLPPPSMRPLLYNLFNQIEPLTTEAENIQTTMDTLINLLPQLLAIKAQIDALLADGIPANDAPNSPEMQAILDVYNDLASGGGMVNQAAVQNLYARMNVYNFQLSQTNTAVATCITETGNGYTPPDERIDYPSDLSAYPNWPMPFTTDAMYLTGREFGGAGSDIDLSGFHNANLSVPSTTVEEFQNYLGVY